MNYEKIITTEPYDLSPHKHAFINPYNGCSMGCPFCFWLSNAGWENRIQIKTNIAEVLEQALKEWPKEEFIYLGSVCDPFNELEREYRLSQQCLQLIAQYQVPLLITTSAVNDVILDYIDILKKFQSRVIVVVELARIPEMESLQRGGVHKGIQNANRLQEEGLEVWTTLAPICPGIIELEMVKDLLYNEIPIYVDSLQCASGSVQYERVERWIRTDYPQFIECYENILNGDTGYFDEIMTRYQDLSRIHRFPFQLK